MNLSINDYNDDLLKDLFDHHKFTDFEIKIISLLFRWYFPEREELIEEMMRSDLDKVVDPQLIEIQFPISRDIDSKSLYQAVYVSVFQRNVAPLQAEVLYGYGWCYIRAYTVDGSSLSSIDYAFDDTEYEFAHIRKGAEDIIRMHPTYRRDLRSLIGFQERKHELEQILMQSKIVTHANSISFDGYNDGRNAFFIALIGRDDINEYHLRIFFDFVNGFFYLDVIKTVLDEDSDLFLALSKFDKYEICANYPNSQPIGELRTSIYTAGYDSLGYSFLMNKIEELRIGVDYDSTVFDYFFGAKQEAGKGSGSELLF